MTAHKVRHRPRWTRSMSACIGLSILAEQRNMQVVRSASLCRSSSDHVVLIESCPWQRLDRAPKLVSEVAPVRCKSSGTSHCHVRVGGQRSHFQRRRGFPHLHQNLAAGSFAAQRNALVVRRLSDDLVAALGASMHRDALSIVDLAGAEKLSL